MRLEPATFYVYEKVNEDVLGNPVYDEIPVEGYKAKISQWTSEEIALLDRTVTQSQRKLLTNAPRSVLKGAKKVSVDGDTYTIISLKSDFIRWRLLHVKEYKQ